MKRVTFLIEYAKNFREVGAVAPSSRFLARKMCAPIDFDSVRVIVEYGPGTGVFSREIISRMHADAKLLLIESNESFYRKLQADFSDNVSVIVEHGSAEDIEMLLNRHSLALPQVIVSGLPFAALPGSISHAILENTRKLLGTRGVFITFQYSLLKKKLFERYFVNVRVAQEMRNIPPAYVLICSNID